MLVVIAYRDLDGDLHGMNAWPASGRDLTTDLEWMTMANKLDPETARAAREDARRLKEKSASEEPYPAGNTISRPNGSSRMFNVRLTEEQFAAIQDLAEQRHLPMSTMARAWLLDRLDHEQHVS